MRKLEFPTDARRPDLSLEYLVTNGLGGFASGPVAGGLTRRYHGLLISALPAPLGRMLYLTHLRILADVGGRQVVIDHEDVARLEADDVARLREFRLESGLPVWIYEVGTLVLEKRIVMTFGENTTSITFRLIGSSDAVRLHLFPLLHVRPHDDTVAAAPPAAPQLTVDGATIEMAFAANWPPLRLAVTGAPMLSALNAPRDVPVEYSVERSRGYDFAGSLWTPGSIDVELVAGDSVTLAASTEDWARFASRSGDEAVQLEQARRQALLVAAGAPADPIVGELTVAADSFLITPVGRPNEVARARAAGHESRTVIAGYHWFTDWGRDTMISLEGLALDTGRATDANLILRTFAHYIRDGLIPNMFPEGEHRGLYHTADATLWFFHAIDRYATRTGDDELVTGLLPALTDIIERHLAGTDFNIGVDPADGLLVQGAPGYQLTWMDAKMGDWVVTPRRGKAVEINALWYNALRLMARWLSAAGQDERAARYGGAADRAQVSFNARFWSDTLCHLYDVVDGETADDPACRPNQIFAIALPNPVLDPARWPQVLDVVERTLLTPVGLRSLAPGHPQYQPKYFGDLQARDAAYHQGTVWAWLIGPFVDAWLKLHPHEFAGARAFLNGFVSHLDDACVGSISEVFDAEQPFTPRGCIAQAWSVAEVLRAWRKTGSA